MTRRSEIKLTKEEQNELNEFVKKGTASARLITRARVLLKMDRSENGEGWTIKQICMAYDVSSITVSHIRHDYVEGGLTKITTRQKSTHEYKRKLDGEAEAQLIAMTCSEAPEGYDSWSLRLLAGGMVQLKIVDSVSYETIRQTLKKTISSRG